MLRRLLPALVFAAVLVTAARPARAGWVIGADLNLGKLFGENTDGFKLGQGANLRLGYGLPIPIIDITAGLNLRYMKWKYDSAGVTGDLSDLSPMVGGRVGAGVLLKPFAELYVGYARLHSTVGGIDETKKGTSLLVGGGLDFSLPLIAVGVHVHYNKDVLDISMTPTQWIAAGADVTLTF